MPTPSEDTLLAIYSRLESIDNQLEKLANPPLRTRSDKRIAWDDIRDIVSALQPKQTHEVPVTPLQFDSFKKNINAQLQRAGVLTRVTAQLSDNRVTVTYKYKLDSEPFHV